VRCDSAYNSEDRLPGAQVLRHFFAESFVVSALEASL
jgi:hypothetical protein